MGTSPKYEFIMESAMAYAMANGVEQEKAAERFADAVAHSRDALDREDLLRIFVAGFRSGVEASPSGTLQGRTVIVEPYGDLPESTHEAVRLAKTLGCTVRLTSSDGLMVEVKPDSKADDVEAAFSDGRAVRVRT